MKVLCSAAVPLKKLFLPVVTSPVYYEDENRALMDDLNITKGSVSILFFLSNFISNNNLKVHKLLKNSRS